MGKARWVLARCGFLPLGAALALLLCAAGCAHGAPQQPAVESDPHETPEPPTDKQAGVATPDADGLATAPGAAASAAAGGGTAEAGTGEAELHFNVFPTVAAADAGTAEP